MVFQLISAFLNLKDYKFFKNNDDDFVDKLSRTFSAIMMLIFASMLTLYGFVGQPIDCWCHNEFSDERCDYAKSYCYITSFYVPVGNATHLPKREDLTSHKIMYYQWIPYIFVFQAFLFYFPCIVW
jgi:innexin